LELRLFYADAADDSGLMRSQLFRGDERLAETADAWHLALIEKGFSEIEL